MILHTVLALCVMFGTSHAAYDDNCDEDLPQTFLPHGSAQGDIMATPGTLNDQRHQFYFDDNFRAFGQTYEDEGFRVKLRQGRSLGVLRVKPSSGFRHHGTFDIRASRLNYYSGNIFMRTSSHIFDLEKVSTLINEAYPCLETGMFSATEVGVITYVCMEYRQQTNTFQVVIAVNGMKTYIMVNYHKLSSHFSLQYGIKDRATHNVYKISGGRVDNPYVLTEHTNGIRKGLWIIDVTENIPRRPESCPKDFEQCTLTHFGLVQSYDGLHTPLPPNAYKILSTRLYSEQSKCNFIIHTKTSVLGTVKFVGLSFGPMTNNDIASMNKFLFGREPNIVELVQPYDAREETVTIPADGYLWPPKSSNPSLLIEQRVDGNGRSSWSVHSLHCNYRLEFKPMGLDPVLIISLGKVHKSEVDGICGNFNADEYDD